MKSFKVFKEQLQLDEAVKTQYVVIDTADDNKVVAAASDEKGAKSSIVSAERPPMSIKDKKTLKIVKLKKPAGEKATSMMIGRSLKEDESGILRLQDKDIEFEIDNIDVEDVLDTEADKFMDIGEDALKTIKSITKDKSAKTVKFADGKSVKVDMQTANVLLKVIDALNDKNKSKFSDMINQSKASFMKAVDFSWKAAK